MLNQFDMRVIQDAARMANQISQQLRDANIRMNEFLPRLQAEFQNVKEVVASIERARRHEEERPRRRAAAERWAADCGWFVTGQIPHRLFRELVKAAEGEHPDTAIINLIMSRVVEYRLDAIMNRIHEEHPKRAHIIQDAINAHRQEKFTLAILAVLAQAEGIWHQETGYLYFSSGRRTKLSDIEQTFWNEWTCQVLVESCIEQDTRKQNQDGQADPNSHQLNRHGVLHGLDTDYATELNSLRAFSFLDYIMEIAPQIRQQGEKAEQAPNQSVSS